MNKYKSILTLLLAPVLFFSTGCRDDFAELNQDPAAITTGTPSFLFSQAILEFEPSGYTYWFYNASEIFQWIQMAVPFNGITSTLTNGAPLQSFKCIDVLKYANELEYVLSQMTEEEREIYAGYKACVDILCVYMGIFDSDFIGNITYTEAAQAAHGGTLTPKYDKVSDLYNVWLTNLDEDIKILTSNTIEITAGQDPVYGGNAINWAKLANSLKLKIAARLISQDKQKAFSIVKEVVQAEVGVLDGEREDFLFNKASENSKNNDWAYHWENDVLRSLGGSKTVIDFMVNNRDPRVRFIFRKNDWNSKIVEAFMNSGRINDIPHYIMENIEYSINSDGKYVFDNWKGAGEPWIRYQGLPLVFNAGQQAGTYGDWFSYETQCQLENITYYPFSEFQKEMIYGRIDFTLKTAPDDGTVIQDTENAPWWGMYMTTAEVNLYLAEFALLGAEVPETAQHYFNRALRASVEEYDRLARMNKIPYYGTTYNYDEHEVVIDVKDGEIDVMMSNSDYQLNGSTLENLEKVYLQQMFHFFMQPIDMFTTARRSGVPVFNSSIFPREDYSENLIPASAIPRRMALSQPSPTDLMYNILLESYQEQGYTVGSGTILNSERIWQDQGAPQWGEGPNL
ncbi:MAG: SusD/RagB family nutrient-binding outer membrane lipoprotein [Tannerellaceae bacterium]|nr:SusD/RagB family nutrient-binding outer membrane lipoprotein [Tannerellaceae bacterium]